MPHDHNAQPTPWRPVAAIRAVAIGIVHGPGGLLVAEVLDDAGNRKGWRPPGGGIRFTEAASDAVLREIREELGCDARIEASPIIFEYFFEHHGAPGHEIVFAYDVALIGSTIPDRGTFRVCEDDGRSHRAEWIELKRFVEGRESLLPTVLAERLLARGFGN